MMAVVTKVEFKNGEGWGAPGNSQKWHYFRGGMSLCGRWMYAGPLDGEDGWVVSADDCAVCVRKRNREIAALAGGEGE